MSEQIAIEVVGDRAALARMVVARQGAADERALRDFYVRAAEAGLLDRIMDLLLMTNPAEAQELSWNGAADRDGQNRGVMLVASYSKGTRMLRVVWGTEVVVDDLTQVFLPDERWYDVLMLALRVAQTAAARIEREQTAVFRHKMRTF